MRVSEGIFDWFKKKEKTIGDSPEYKGWLNIYLKNPDVEIGRASCRERV